jgi:hypothetical protein
MKLHNSTRPQAAASRCHNHIKGNLKQFKPFQSVRSCRSIQVAAAAAEQEAAVAAPEPTAAAASPASPLTSISPLSSQDDFNQHVREGHYEAPLMQEQVCDCVTELKGHRCLRADVSASNYTDGEPHLCRKFMWMRGACNASAIGHHTPT